MSMGMGTSDVYDALDFVITRSGGQIGLLFMHLT